MAVPLQIHQHPKESAGLPSDKATPPEKQIQPLLTPPTTSERIFHGTEAFAVDSALQLFRQHQDSTLEDPWTSISLKPAQYQRLLRQVKCHPTLFAHVDNNVRFDYDARLMLLSVRMPTPVHEFIIASITAAFCQQLEVIRQRGDSSADFATHIASGGCARIFLKEDSPVSEGQGPRVCHRREPDAQFHHRNAEYPGVVLEISYSQEGKDLNKLAWDYIQYSNGDIKMVIGIDISYSNTKEATLSVWRPRYVHEDGEDADILEAEEVIKSQPFRAADGSTVNSTKFLSVNLDNFATDEITNTIDFGDCTGVNISYQQLSQFLASAEERQEAREPAQGVGSQSVKSRRKTRKRKRSSTPFDRLRSSDEAEHLEQEAQADERINTVDGDFHSRALIEAFNQEPRRSKRQVLPSTSLSRR